MDITTGYIRSARSEAGWSLTTDTNDLSSRWDGGDGCLGLVESEGAGVEKMMFA